jgi:hypothetical protein
MGSGGASMGSGGASMGVPGASVSVPGASMAGLPGASMPGLLLPSSSPPWGVPGTGDQREQGVAQARGLGSILPSKPGREQRIRLTRPPTAGIRWPGGPAPYIEGGSVGEPGVGGAPSTVSISDLYSCRGRRRRRSRLIDQLLDRGP